MSKIDEFHERRNRGNEKIMGEDFLPFKRFMALDSRAYEEGAIPAKYKELMGLAGSMVLRCDDCITCHIDNCVKAGCTREEINEALNIAVVIGGSITIPHLREAMEVLKEVY